MQINKLSQSPSFQQVKEQDSKKVDEAVNKTSQNQSDVEAVNLSKIRTQEVALDNKQDKIDQLKKQVQNNTYKILDNQTLATAIVKELNFA